MENYYNTLLKTVNIDDLQELLHFLNTNKPVKKVIKAPVSPSVDKNMTPKNEKKDKQVQLKKIFEEIVTKTFK